MTLNVTPVNDAPVGVNETIPIFEDNTYAFTVNDFSFSDPGDASPANSGPMNNFLNAIITPPPSTAGTLKLGTTSLTPGTPAVIPVSSINASQLIFTPAANINSGNAVSPTISFKVQDDGGVTSGGQDVSVTANTFTFNIASVNDPPFGTNRGGSVPPAFPITMLEDSSYTFSRFDFGFSDFFDSPPDNLLAVKITALPANGTLSVAGSAVSPGQFVSVTDVNSGALVFRPVPNENGSGYTAFTFQVQDDGGTANGGVDLDPTPNSIWIDVIPVNDPPTGADKFVTTLEDAPYTLSVADFGFSDLTDALVVSGQVIIPPNLFKAVIVTSVPAHGTLSLSEAPVLAAQLPLVIPVAQIGGLVFQPAPNENGAAYGEFAFRVQDDGGIANGGVDISLTRNTITFNLTAVNDAPIGASNAISVLEDSVHTFIAPDFGFTDPHDNPQDTFAAVKITTLPTNGTLLLGGAAVKAGDFVPAVSVSSLTFSPAANGNGAAYASFTFQVQDNGLTANSGADLDPVPKTITLSVTPVNDAPTGRDATISGIEDHSHTFAVSDFGFSDAADSSAPSSGPPNGILSVLIVSTPTHGTLTVNGNAISAGAIVLSSQINSGSLVFVPAPDDNGVSPPYDAFTFKVQDDGGTANGGQDTDPIARTLSLAIAPVNDPPGFLKGADQNVTDESGVQSIARWATSMSVGPHDESAQHLHFTVQTIINAALFSSPPTIDSSGNLTFTPAANVAGSAQITIVAQDDGGTANGGQDISPPQTFTINVAKAHVWHNASNGLDVIANGHITPNDALSVINFINAFGSQHVPNNGSASGPYLDVNANGFVAPNDALAVINYINAFGSGEGESAASSDDLLNLLAYDIAAARKEKRT